MRTALIPINPTVGDIAGNATLIRNAITTYAERADLMVFPEMCVCGYPPKDLLWHDGFIQACEAAADEIAQSAPTGVAVVLGLPLLDRSGPNSPAKLRNALIAYRDGKRIATYFKRLLPTYDVFDEDRFFVAADAAVVFEHHGHTIGLSICEDLWRGEDAGTDSRYAGRADPIADLAAAGAEVIINPSACPFVLGKQTTHRAIIEKHARERGVALVTVNQHGATDDLIFDGHATVANANGQTVAESDPFSGDALIVDLNALPGHPTEIERKPERMMFEALRLGVADYLRKTGFSSAIIGLSGGIDSALTAAVAVAALGPDHVTGVSMPSSYSSDHSKSDAFDLADRLGIRCISSPIADPQAGFTATLNTAFDDLGAHRLGDQRPDLAEENLQSRIRGTLLMAISNRKGALVLTTGNKSEYAVGYCTLYGDMNGGLAVLNDVPKTWVYRLSRWINQHAESIGLPAAPIPKNTILKPPSAELAPGQKDSDSLPEYEILDEIVERAIEHRQSIDRIASDTGFDRALVERIVRLIDRSEYKRQQAAIGLKVTTVAFGSGRRVPVAQRWPHARELALTAQTQSRGIEHA